MDELIDLSGPLGLLTEEMEPDSHAMRGNFPQALTHLALILSALGLNDALDGKGPIRSKAA